MKSLLLFGHVDHGKSTLAGHLLYLSGYVDEHKMEEIKKKALEDKMEKWSFARILDVFEEEQIRGKTHNWTYIDFKHKDQLIRIIDTPGHKSFITEMIEGCSKFHIDTACLVVSALKGELESAIKGDLEEHIIIVRGLGIKNLIVAINKIDMIDYNNEVKNNIIETLDLKKYRFSKVDYVPISALNNNYTDNSGKSYDILTILDKVSISISTSISISISNEVEIEIVKNLSVNISEVKNTSKISMQVLICKKVFLTIGSNLILHVNNQIINGVIVSIRLDNAKGTKQRFIKDCPLLTYMILKVDNVSLNKGNVIVRTPETTIAFGKII